MPIQVSCPQCSLSYQVAEGSLGGQARCKCGHTFTLAIGASETNREPLRKGLPISKAGNSGDPSASKIAVAQSAARQGTVAPATSVLSGRLGRFEIRTRLGAGAFGAVYRAFDTVLKREVALKVPHPSSLLMEGMGARFLREAEAAAQLRHPNIVPIYDAGSEGDQLYIASAYIEGRTLHAALKTKRPDQRTAARWIMKLAEALGYAHSQKVIHRDVKPANVMLDSKDDPHLMDFGLARWEAADQQLTQDGSFLGTPLYMSPEQTGATEMGPVGPASDQYSLGVMLYEMLCGKVPFEAPLAALIYQIRDVEPVKPREKSSDIARDLETICLKALSKQPKDRYGSCQSLAEDLGRWIAGEPIRARRLGRIERFVRWSRKHKTVATLTVAVATLSIVGVVGATISITRQAELANQEFQARQQAIVAQKSAESATQTADIRRQEAERNTYLNLIAQADREISSENLDRADEILDDCDIESRNWEWHYLKRVSNPESLSLATDSDQISADATKVAISGSRNDFQVEVVDIISGRTVKIPTPKAFHTCVVLSPDGQKLALDCNSDKHKKKGEPHAIEIWDVPTRRLLFTCNDHLDRIEGLCFSPDSQWLASSNQGKVVFITDVGTGKVIHRLTGGRGELYFTADGMHLMSQGWAWYFQDGEAKTALLHQSPAPFTAEGKLASTFRERAQTDPFFLKLQNLALSPDGKQLASFKSNTSLAIWNIESGEPISITTIKGRGEILWPSEGNRLVTKDRYSVRYYDTRTLLPGSLANLATSRPSYDYEKVALISPTGDRVAIVTKEKSIRIIGVNDGRELAVLEKIEFPIQCWTFSGDGGCLATAICRPRNGLDPPVDILVWDLKTRKVLNSFKDVPRPSQMTFSPDGKYLACAARKHAGRGFTNNLIDEVIIRELPQGRIVHRLAGGGGAAFSPDGKLMATASDDYHHQIVKVWDTATGQMLRVLSGHDHIVKHVAFSHDGTRVASSTLGAAYVHNAKDGQLVSQYRGNGSPLGAIIFSPDDSRLLVGHQDGVISILHPETGQVTLNLRRHTSQVSDLAFTSDDQSLVSSTDKGDFQLWHAPPYVPSAVQMKYGPVRSRAPTLPKPMTP